MSVDVIIKRDLMHNDGVVGTVLLKEPVVNPASGGWAHGFYGVVKYVMKEEIGMPNDRGESNWFAVVSSLDDESEGGDASEYVMVPGCQIRSVSVCELSNVASNILKV